MSRSRPILLFLSMSGVVAEALLSGNGLLAAEVRYTGANLRDPFVEQAAVQPQEDVASVDKKIGLLSLEGILFDVDHPRAIISGRIFQEGSEVGPGAKVVRINKDSVILDVLGKSYTIKQTIRKTSDDNNENSASSQKK